MNNMNDQISQLLEQLADKFGTTADHLWGVMLKQAPIQATTELVFFAVFFAGLAIAFKKLKKLPLLDEYKCPVLEACVAWVVYACIAILFFNALVTCLPLDIAAFVNPEYWALRQIIH